MGLFWGSEDAAKVNKERERERLKETDPRYKSLEILSFDGCSWASDEFGFLFRDMYQQICEMHRSMNRLTEENKTLHMRVEILEKQVATETKQHGRSI